ncbi:NADP-dependent oxidoreductase domain-containing protein 1 [Spheniscus humboldti]
MWDITEPFKSSQADEAVEVYPPHADLSLSLVIVWVDVSARQSRTEKRLPTSLGDCHILKVGIIGIIGGGYLGKQLAQALLTLSWAPHPSSCVSTRRPESLADLQKQGLACFYDNTQLVAWADVASLCCLQSHVPSICFVIRPAIQKPSVVYSLVTTIPLLRTLKPHDPTRAVRPPPAAGTRSAAAQPGLSGSTLSLSRYAHFGLLRFRVEATPSLQCHCEASALARSLSMSGGRRGQSQRAAKPCRCAGNVPLPFPRHNFYFHGRAVPIAGCYRWKIKVSAEWLVAIFYAALKSSTWQSLPHQKALKLFSDLCFPECCPICAKRKTSGPQFVCKSFVNKVFASSVSQEENFPWFDPTSAQLRECPFSQLLEQNGTGQAHSFLIL